MFLDLPELSGKQLGLLKEIVPGLSRIAIFGIPGLNALQFAATETAPQALTIQSETIEIRSSDDIERALETATTRGVEAGIVLQSPLAFNTSKQFAELAMAKRLPLISLFAEFPKAGGLIGYVQRRVVGRRSREHPKPNLPAAKRKAREGPLRSLPSLVCRLQPRPAFARSSRRDIVAPRPGF